MVLFLGVSCGSVIESELIMSRFEASRVCVERTGSSRSAAVTCMAEDQ